jgi:hypothetical protein
MNSEALLNAATFIVRQNASANLISASVEWDRSIACLTITSIFECDPSEDDLEHGELSVAELLAEFPDVVTVETKYKADTGQTQHSPDAMVVYQRRQS